MEKLRQTVIIGCLIYGLYGLVSWLNLGAFVPPIPLKPFLLAAFLIVFLFDKNQKSLTALNISFLIWLTSLIFTGQYLAETFFDFRIIHFYVNVIEPFVLLGSIIAFIIFVFLFSRKLEYTDLNRFMLLFLSVSILLLFLFIENELIYNWGVILIAFLIFGFNRKKHTLNENFQKIEIALVGLATINIMEQVAFLL